MFLLLYHFFGFYGVQYFFDLNSNSVYDIVEQVDPQPLLFKLFFGFALGFLN